MGKRFEWGETYRLSVNEPSEGGGGLRAGGRAVQPELVVHLEAVSARRPSGYLRALVRQRCGKVGPIRVVTSGRINFALSLRGLQAGAGRREGRSKGKGAARINIATNRKFKS